MEKPESPGGQREEDRGNIKWTKTMLMSGLSRRERKRFIIFISRVLHEAYQFLNQKLKSTGTSEDKKKWISNHITPGNFILIVIILFTYITEKKHPFCSKYINYIGKINIETLNRYWLEQALRSRNIHRKGEIIQNMRLNTFKAYQAYWTSKICTCILKMNFLSLIIVVECW